ncbi:MAG: hypothetical protein Q7K57_52335 [Burkholderiaceae bacterium]|nr:hypothetical protein [Burkholderiaceae bacterium]
MSLAVTLIIISVLAGSVPGPVVNTQAFTSKTDCKKVLDASVQGIKSAYIGNSTGSNHDVQILLEDGGWTVIRTPMGRIINQLKCQE